MVSDLGRQLAEGQAVEEELGLHVTKVFIQVHTRAELAAPRPGYFT